ncbi:MAG: signal peptidase I [Acidobacteriota bacterium]
MTGDHDPPEVDEESSPSGPSVPGAPLRPTLPASSTGEPGETTPAPASPLDDEGAPDLEPSPVVPLAEPAVSDDPWPEVRDEDLGTELEEAEAAAPGPRTPSRPTGVRLIIETLIIAVLVVLFGTRFVVQNSVIPSASMEDTLLIGDYVLVDRFVFSAVDADEPSSTFFQRPIERGDVVVFKYPPDPSLDYVKRVVGLPGDVIEIRSKQVFIDGKRLDEPYKMHSSSRIYRPRTDAGRRDHLLPVRVPPGHYFVMGDNRDHSADSREWRFLPRENIRGRALLVFWSRDSRPGEWEVAGSWTRVKNLWRALRSFPDDTRWERIGRPVE